MYDGIRKMLHHELEQIEQRNNMTPDLLCQIYQISGALHRLDEIEEYEMENSEYTERPYMYRGRDSRGRYTSRSRYYRDDEREHLAHEVNELLHDSDSEREREAYRKVLKKIDRSGR